MTASKSSDTSVNIKGEVSVHTGNILPIIKKWLYSEHDIFLRELVSNAYDATIKRKKVAMQAGNADVPDAKIEILVDKDAKTLTIRDNGLGMTAEEVQKYINQIAFSGAEEFVKKYQDDDESKQVIGHFGLGFYSAFMAADKVEILTLSHEENAQAVRWVCEGSTEFSLTSDKKDSVGSDVILHVNEDSEKYLDDTLIENLIKKYDNFLPVEICVGERAVNDKNPLWVKDPKEVTEEEYKSFYQTLFPFSQEPLFWIHLNVDYPFNLKGILYFPKLMHEMDSSKGQVKLFCKQVFVTDHTKEVLPEFLTLLKGAIDCPEIPLNVSRSYLQNDPYVQKISKHIVKKVADKLNELFKKDRENFETYWDDIHPFIKYGMMNDVTFYDKVKESLIFTTSAGKKMTLAEYKEAYGEASQKSVIYCANKDGQAAYVAMCQEHGIEVIYLESVIDTHFIQFLESRDTDTKYQSVDSDLNHLFVDEADREALKADESQDEKEGDEKKEPELSPDDTLLKTLFESVVGKDTKVKIAGLKTEQIPAMIQESEQSKRMKAMSAMMGGQMPAFPDDLTLMVNRKHPMIQNILTRLKAQPSDTLAKDLGEQVADLAMMSFKPLSGDKMAAFLKRSGDLLTNISGK